MSDTNTNTPPRSNLTGRQFGRLTVLKFVDYRHKNSRWLCLCVCGNKRVVSRSDLGRGSKSCGCWRTEISTARVQSHGLTDTSEHYTWRSMIQRTTNPRNKRFADYGGRGITVCDRWRSFENFYADMGPKPTPSHQIDRIRNEGNYEPGNCRWATKTEQARNKRTNRVIEFNGQFLTLAAWSEISGIKYTTIRNRLDRGWSIADALTR
jgi:hypothetical protein